MGKKKKQQHRESLQVVKESLHHAGVILHHLRDAVGALEDDESPKRHVRRAIDEAEEGLNNLDSFFETVDDDDIPEAAREHVDDAKTTVKVALAFLPVAKAGVEFVDTLAEEIL